MFIPAKVRISSVHASHPSPSIATFEPFIAIKSAGITMGKLRTAIKVKLLPALAAIMEFNVKALAKAADAKKVTVKKITRFSIGFPRVTINSKVATEASRKVSIVL